ncbi:CUB domain-containing protein 1 [Arapaima gigas]
MRANWRLLASGCAVALLRLVLPLCLPPVAECQQLTVSPGADTTVTISTLTASPCMVCLVQDGVSDVNCSYSLTVKPSGNAGLHFNCSDPQKSFAIEIRKKVECTLATCSPAIAPTLTSIFKDFSRTFIWDLTSLPEMSLGLDFPAVGLKNVGLSEACVDGYRYTIFSAQPPGKAYCRQGSLTHLDLRSPATVSLQVPSQKELDSGMFSVVTKPLAKKGRVMTVTPDSNTVITIKKVNQDSNCTVCNSKGSKPSCSTSLTLKATTNTTVEFTCPQPQEAFSVEINKEIVCSVTSCNGDIVQSESSLFADFNRTFSWDIKTVGNKVFQVDFPDSGMRQISPDETCPDQSSYTLIIYQRSGLAIIGVFCRVGHLRKVRMPYKGRVAVAVPGLRTLDPFVFNVSAGPNIRTLAEVFIEVPNGESTMDIFSPNYPNGFPDDDLMAWNFQIPPKHNYTVKFLKYTEPQCQKKDVEVEYMLGTRRSGISMALSDLQPSQMQGSFRMLLRNCETVRSADVPVLSLSFQVSVTRSSLPVICSVDRPEEDGFTLFINKTGPSALCELKMDSVIQEEIVLRPGTNTSLSFQDCRSDELILTASRTIECLQWKKCPVNEILLTVPTLESCLPTVLRNITWQIYSQEESTVELLAPAAGLQQSLAGQECNSNLSAAIVEVEVEGVCFGTFCPGGPLQKVQIHGNVSITTTSTRTLGLSWMKEPFLSVSFNNSTTETYVLTVVPGTNSPALLATPGWPQGMPPNSTVSWVVQLPPQQQAELLLTSDGQPKCAVGHSSIVVQALDSSKPMLSRNEGEMFRVERLTTSDSFYVKVSNCVPENGAFSMLTKITMQKKSNALLSIILGAVGALLLLLIAVLVVVCLVTSRKKKSKKRVSIYNPNGNVFAPGTSKFPKNRENNESHVYASIDETLMYTHLLRTSDQDTYRGPQVNMFPNFPGPMDGKPVDRERTPEPEVDGFQPFLEPVPTIAAGRPHTPIARQDSLAYTDPRMVDNELYTFKTNGDLGVRFLTLKEKEPEAVQNPDIENDEFESD